MFFLYWNFHKTWIPYSLTLSEVISGHCWWMLFFRIEIVTIWYWCKGYIPECLATVSRCIQGTEECCTIMSTKTWCSVPRTKLLVKSATKYDLRQLPQVVWHSWMEHVVWQDRYVVWLDRYVVWQDRYVHLLLKKHTLLSLDYYAKSRLISHWYNFYSMLLMFTI